MGLMTVLGWRRRGYFIPYRYADAVPDGAVRKGYETIGELFEARRPAFSQMLTAIDGYADTLMGFGKAPPPEPRWHQGWFPRLDAAAAYAMVRDRRPRRIVEVGSGHSTRFFARAVGDERLDTRITAIDPAPRADIAELDVQLFRTTVQEAGPEPFAQLAAGDVLSIDSSHILMPGSDVDFLLNRVLPGLPAGLILHIHDIFLPDAYPRDWDWRGYNEQQGVAPLIHGGGYDLLWSSQYATTRMTDEIGRTVVARLELMDGVFESSLWLEKL
jgi:methyltransferase family protein